MKNRLHMDLRSRDQAAETARLESMGARRIDIGQGDVSWVVMADPEGNEFCILRDPAPDEAEDLFYGRPLGLLNARSDQNRGEAHGSPIQ